MDIARRSAYDVLHEVGASDGYANLLTRRVFAERRLDGRDAAFATELVMGTLRRRGTLDSVLAQCVTRPLAKLDPRVLDALRMGTYQVLFMDTATHAAVNSTVELVGEVSGPGPRGLTNAVMRKVAGHDLPWWLAKLTDGVEDRLDELAVRHAHPRWIISALRDALGGDDAALEALLERNNAAPPVTLVARPGRSSVSELMATPDAQSAQYSPLAVRLSGGRPGSVPAVREQRAAVQDEGSQLVTLALAAASAADPDLVETAWLDMCAGPGGKAGLLAALAAERAVALMAVEPRAARARLVARTLTGSPGMQLVVQADGREGPWRPDTFDRVLVDAPCTGIGVLRRRPEARWRRQPTDVAALAPLQRELLHAAIVAARPGGLIAYVTCSPHIAETDLVVDEILHSRDDVVEADARAALAAAVAGSVAPSAAETLGGELPARSTAGLRVRLWPHLHDTDGMFLALLRKRGSPLSR